MSRRGRRCAVALVHCLPEDDAHVPVKGTDHIEGRFSSLLGCIFMLLSTERIPTNFYACDLLAHTKTGRLVIVRASYPLGLVSITSYLLGLASLLKRVHLDAIHDVKQGIG